MQTPLHRACKPHVPEQEPATQLGPVPAALQSVAQSPQWAGSVRRLVQTPLQMLAGVQHVELSQVTPASHARPQRPQFCASDPRSTQTPWHSTVGVGHGSHEPPTQMLLAGQGWSQLPHAARFVSRSTHLALQHVSPSAQAVAPHLHSPLTQLCCGGHVLPHSPQLAVFASRFKHPVLQHARPLAHGESLLAEQTHAPPTQSGAPSEPQGSPHAPQLAGSVQM